jgi:uncharacterized protein (DUF1499 family)
LTNMVFWFTRSIRNIDFGTHSLHWFPNYYVVIPLDAYKNNKIMNKEFKLSNAIQTKAQDKNAPTFDFPAIELKRLWDKIIAALPRTTILDQNDQLLKYAYVQRTPIMKFPDYFTVQFLDLEDGKSTLVIYSKAKYGGGDKNFNMNRVKQLIDDLKKLASNVQGESTTFNAEIKE